ncbi:MAG: FHA domain-containing protein [Candidatus Sumerlaeota bacterium]|nr:FHA domain-containing protein [Candidatus Sumerlaeota bacterium]
MPDDKIQINWDDLNRPEVDARLEQERRMKAAAAHYQQHAAPGTVAQPGVPMDGQRVYGQLASGPARVSNGASAGLGSGSLAYSSVVYMCVAGLLMAFIGWAVTEGRMNREEANENTLVELITDALERRGLTFAEVMEKPETEQQRIIDEIKAEIRGRKIAKSALWFAIIGAFIGLGLGAAEGAVSRAYQAAVVAGLVGGLAGFIGGGIAGGMAQILYVALLSAQSEQGSLGLQILARTMGWGLAGMLLGIGQAIPMKSAKKIRNGLLGGLAGGLIGGFLFDSISLVFHSGGTSRMMALCVIGGATGSMIGIVENLLKDAWLRVVAGPLTGKQFVIYRNPTAFGSSPKADIYLFKDPSIEPRHALLHSTPQGYVLEDTRSASGTYVNGRRVAQQRLRPNDLIQIGQYQFAYGEKARASIVPGGLA